MNFDGFRVVDFPPINHDVPGFVYVLFYVRGDSEAPFYVGQTKRIWGRLDDYYWAMYSAATDSRVGEAIRQLAKRGCRVLARYKSSSNRVMEEVEIVEALRTNYALLNDEPSFDYTSAHESEQRSMVEQFIDRCLSVD